jgi:hypothetical protein
MKFPVPTLGLLGSAELKFGALTGKPEHALSRRTTKVIWSGERVMKKLGLVLLLLLPVVSGATDISVGGVSLAIPNPDGFSPVTPQMTTLYEIQKQFVAPTNEEFAAFIPDRDISAVLKDEIPDLPRRFTVQTSKELIRASVATSDFAKLKNIIKTQNNELIKRTKAQLPGVTKQINEGINKKYGVDLAFSISQITPMPVHAETDRILAYSALVKYDMKDENGIPASFVSASTITLVHVKSKVLILNSYAEESGLDWCREVSRQWAKAVVAANPSDFHTSVKEALPPAVSGINWEKAGVKVAVVIISGLIIGLVSLIRWLIIRARRAT